MASILEGVRFWTHDDARDRRPALCTQITGHGCHGLQVSEKPGEGDDTRRMGSFHPTRRRAPTATTRRCTTATTGAKRSVLWTITPGRGAGATLASRCDVVVENYKAGSLAKCSLDRAGIRALRPTSYCSVTGYHDPGRASRRSPAYGFILQGPGRREEHLRPSRRRAGRRRDAHHDPHHRRGHGLGHATIGILGALHHRRRTGQGPTRGRGDAGRVRGAQRPPRARLYLMTGRNARVTTSAIASPLRSCSTADRRLIVAVGNNGQFGPCAVCWAARSGLQDARFATNARRVAHRAELRDLLAVARLLELAAFEQAGVPAGRSTTWRRSSRDPQTRHHELAFPLPTGARRRIKLRNPIRYSQTPMRYRAAPMLGQDSEGGPGASAGSGPGPSRLSAKARHYLALGRGVAPPKCSLITIELQPPLRVGHEQLHDPARTGAGPPGCLARSTSRAPTTRPTAARWRVHRVRVAARRRLGQHAHAHAGLDHAAGRLEVARTWMRCLIGRLRLVASAQEDGWPRLRAGPRRSSSSVSLKSICIWRRAGGRAAPRARAGRAGKNRVSRFSAVRTRAATMRVGLPSIHRAHDVVRQALAQVDIHVGVAARN